MRAVLSAWPKALPLAPLWVIDDGSSDRTARVADAAGARVLRISSNQGKGAALRIGLRECERHGVKQAVTLDADGQHPAEEAVRLGLEPVLEEPELLLGVRALAAAGAPRANQFSNAFSNAFLSFACGYTFHDTQCGLRRYPVTETLALGSRARGYGFEAEVLIRALKRGYRVRQLPVRVIYPEAHERISHFHVVRDPSRIVVRVLHTLLTAK